MPVLIVLVVCSAALAERVEEKYADGKTKASFTKDEKGLRQGISREFFSSGKMKSQALYRDNLLSGEATEWNEQGKITATATWLDGVLLCPQSKAQIEAELGRIAVAHVEGPGTAASLQVIRKLMAYRYICGLPHDIALDKQMNAEAAAAAELCSKLNRLTHNPDRNPGMSDEQFKLAKSGAGKSNLYMDTYDPLHAIEGFMDDSSPGNMDRLGHRRWCLNPAMAKAGFAVSGNYAALWASDASRGAPVEWDMVAYPARGLMPSKLISPKAAWSVTLNTEKYERPGDAVKVKVYAVTGHPVKLEDFKGQPPLEIDFFKVDTQNFGVPNCIIFKPHEASTRPGQRYWVEIEGLRLRDGKPAALAYYVEFI